MAYTRGIQAAKSGRDFWANQKEILSKIDAESILEHYGAQNVSESHSSQGRELVHSCLIDSVKPHHTNGDQSASASLNADKLLYNCWSGFGGDILWLIQEMEDCSREHALEILAGFIVDTDEPRYSAVEAIRKIYSHGDAEDAPIPKYSTIILEPWLALHPYLYEDRQFCQETLKRYSLGYDDEYCQIVIPHFWLGKLVGYQKRRLDSPNWPKSPSLDKHGHVVPKYKNSKSFPKDSTIFNFDTVLKRQSKRVVVTESVMSVLRAESWFDEGNEQWGGVLATFGAKITKAQIEILRQFEGVDIMLDPDYAGWYGTIRLYDGLKDFCSVRIIDGLPEGKDLADLGVEEAEAYRTKAKPGSLAIAGFRKRTKK